MCEQYLANDTHMLIKGGAIYCTHCKELVTYDGGNWINCHCFGCRDIDTESFPPQWEIDETKHA